MGIVSMESIYLRMCNNWDSLHVENNNMVKKMNLRCPFCGRKLQMVIDTPLCPICDVNIIYELNVWVRKDIENIKVKK